MCPPHLREVNKDNSSNSTIPKNTLKCIEGADSTVRNRAVAAVVLVHFLSGSLPEGGVKDIRSTDLFCDQRSVGVTQSVSPMVQL